MDERLELGNHLDEKSEIDDLERIINDMRKFQKKVNHMDKKLELGLRILDAMDTGNLDELHMLFQTTERNVLEITPKEQWNWLHKALLAAKPNVPPVNVINYLINTGIDINAQDIYGMTPLHYAMQYKNVDAAMALVNAGADPNIPNRDQVIPLAMIGGVPEALDLLKLMLDKGGNVHYFNGQNELLAGMKKYCSQLPKFKPVIELMEQYA